MSLHILHSEIEVAIQTATALVALVHQKPNALICVAAGHTQHKMFEVLEIYYQMKKVDFSNVRIIELDEWVGLGEDDKGSCQYFLTHRFYNKVGILPHQVQRFNAKSESLEEECKKACDYLDENGPIDLVILGVGMNGHVGFNEPYTAQTSRAFYLELDEVSTCIGQKYFSNALKLEKGITLGLKDLLDAKHVIIQVTGCHKAAVVKLFMEHVQDIAVPVTLFRDRKNTKIFIDEQAGSMLQ